MAVKERSPAEVTLYAGYTNGLVSYFPTAAEYPFGGYEPGYGNRTFGLPAQVVPECERILVEAGAQLVHKLFPERRAPRCRWLARDWCAWHFPADRSARATRDSVIGPMTESRRVAFYGRGQVAANTAAILDERHGIEVVGAFRRDERDAGALRSGPDVVVIATTSFCQRSQLLSRPQSTPAGRSSRRPRRPCARGLTMRRQRIPRCAGSFPRSNGSRRGPQPWVCLRCAGVDGLRRLCGVRSLPVEPVVDLAGFGAVVSRRIGIGYTSAEFAEGCRITAASLTISFSTPARELFEVKLPRNPMQHELVTTPFAHLDGWAYPPTGPGLGIEVVDDVWFATEANTSSLDAAWSRLLPQTPRPVPQTGRGLPSAGAPRLTERRTAGLRAR